MNETIHLGRIAGVRVGLHWSVVGIVVLVTVGLAAVQLPAAFPRHSAVGYAMSGVGAAVLLVASLLVHEVAHAIVAQRNDVRVDGITLWLLGGVARMRGEAPNPGAEFRIAIVGPAASSLLVVIFGIAAWGFWSAGADVLVVAVLGYLSLLNLLLAVFNLIPAAPLDGGRVLRAALWAWRGDPYKAAVWSAWAGRGFGFLLLAAGFVELLRSGVEGLWWVLLGWFVVSVASAEEHQARLGVELAGVRVRDVMTTPVEAADGKLTVAEFLRTGALQQRHATYPLADESGRFEGLVTLSALRSIPAHQWETLTLQEAAQPPHKVVLASPDDPLASALIRLPKAAYGRIVVTSGDELAGIVSPSDISAVVAERGLRIAVPGGADLRWEPNTPPPAGWWYPGRHR